MRSGLPGPLQPPYPALTDVHDAVLRLDVRGDDGRVAVDQHLAARDDEDDGLVVERALLLEVEDLRRVQAVVEQVVLEDLGELRRVREEVAEERLVEVGEGLVVGREDCEGVALLRRALRGYRRESRVKEGSARGLLVGGGWLLRRVAGVHIVASPHNILTCLERRHEAGRRDGRDERRQAGRGLRESDDVLLGEGEVGRDHCSGDAAAGGTEAGVRGGQPRGSHAGPLRTDTVDDVEDAVGRVEVRADDVRVVDGNLAARDADAQRVGRVERRDLLAVRELVGERAPRGDVVGQDVAVDHGVEAVRDDCGCGARRGTQESCRGLNLTASTLRSQSRMFLPSAWKASSVGPNTVKGPSLQRGAKGEHVVQDPLPAGHAERRLSCGVTSHGPRPRTRAPLSRRKHRPVDIKLALTRRASG